MSQTLVEGSAGRLEVRTDAPERPPRAVAVLCHPHPAYGGSMHDGVLDLAVTPLLDAGVACVRFNFRGVGSSEGRFDDGEGEREDVVSIARWMRSEHPGLPLALVGYSFGAAMIWAASAAVAPDAMLLIAPPIAHMDFDRDCAPSCPAIVAVGEQDPFAPLARVDQLREDLAHAGGLHVGRRGDHFFSGCARTVEDAAAELAQTI